MTSTVSCPSCGNSGGSGTSDLESAEQSNAPPIMQPLREKEPWYYESLQDHGESWVRLAKAFVLLWAVVYLIGTAILIVAVMASCFSEAPPSLLKVYNGALLYCALSAVFCWCVFSVKHIMMLIAAWILLAVDHARNSRLARVHYDETNDIR